MCESTNVVSYCGICRCNLCYICWPKIHIEKIKTMAEHAKLACGVNLTGRTVQFDKLEQRIKLSMKLNMELDILTVYKEKRLLKPELEQIHRAQMEFQRIEEEIANQKAAFIQYIDGEIDKKIQVVEDKNIDNDKEIARIRDGILNYSVMKYQGDQVHEPDYRFNFGVEKMDVPRVIRFVTPESLKGTYHVITESGVYRVPVSCTATVILIGAGASGGQGGGGNRAGGSSGEVLILKNHQLDQSKIYDVSIGKGGIYNPMGDTTGMNNGESTKFDMFTAIGGESPDYLKYGMLCGSKGFVGGGAGNGSCTEPGGNGGSIDHPNGYSTSDNWKGGIGTCTLDIKYFKSIHPDITIGNGGKGGHSMIVGHSPGGGSGGVVVKGYDVNGGDGKGPIDPQFIVGQGGRGFGSAGAGGSFDKKIYDAGCGAPGCVIIVF